MMIQMEIFDNPNPSEYALGDQGALQIYDTRFVLDLFFFGLGNGGPSEDRSLFYKHEWKRISRELDLLLQTSPEGSVFYLPMDADEYGSTCLRFVLGLATVSVAVGRTSMVMYQLTESIAEFTRQIRDFRFMDGLLEMSLDRFRRDLAECCPVAVPG